MRSQHATSHPYTWVVRGNVQEMQRLERDRASRQDDIGTLQDMLLIVENARDDLTHDKQVLTEERDLLQQQHQQLAADCQALRDEGEVLRPQVRCFRPSRTRVMHSCSEALAPAHPMALHGFHKSSFLRCCHHAWCPLLQCADCRKGRTAGCLHG